MKPTFVSRGAPGSRGGDAQPQPWGARGRRRSPRSQLSKFPLKQEEEEDGGEKALTLLGQRTRGEGHRSCWRLATQVEQRASLCLQALRGSSTEFNFPRPDRRRWGSAGGPAQRPHAAPRPPRGQQHGRGCWDALRVVSLLAEEAQITTWVLFFILYLNLDLFV